MQNDVEKIIKEYFENKNHILKSPLIKVKMIGSGAEISLNFDGYFLKFRLGSFFLDKKGIEESLLMAIKKGLQDA